MALPSPSRPPGRGTGYRPLQLDDEAARFRPRPQRCPVPPAAIVFALLFLGSLAVLLATEVPLVSALSWAGLLSCAGGLVTAVFCAASTSRRVVDEALADEIAAAAEADFASYAPSSPTDPPPEAMGVPRTASQESVVELGADTKCDIPRRHSW